MVAADYNSLVRRRDRASNLSASLLESLLLPDESILSDTY